MTPEETKIAIKTLEHAHCVLSAGPKTWIQENGATTAKGRSVPPKSKLAVCFCSLGAIDAVAPDVPAMKLSRELLSEVIEDWRTGSYGAGSRIIDFNNKPKRKYREVVRKFEKAIEHGYKLLAEV